MNSDFFLPAHSVRRRNARADIYVMLAAAHSKALAADLIDTRVILAASVIMCAKNC